MSIDNASRWITKAVAILAFLRILSSPFPTCAAESNTSTNLRPLVAWLSPANNSTFPAYSSITLKAYAGDPDGSIKAVHFIQAPNRILGSATAPPYTFTWKNVAPGTYTLFALALDNLNAGASTPKITITVGGSSGGGSPPPPPPPPQPPTQYTLTVNSGSGSGQYTAGTIVTITANPAPAGQVFQKWTGATVTDPNAPSTTLTMPASNVSVTANYFTPPPVPFPVASHPRLWITTNDIARLRSWANSNNPIYQQGLLPLMNTAAWNHDHLFFPGGVPNAQYPDPGDTQGYVGELTEENGILLAFQSLVDPDPNVRMNCAQRARNVLMYAMNEAAKGHLAGAPFRDPLFVTYNRGNGSGEEWPLIVDWIYNATDANGDRILTAQDKLTIRNVFMLWASDCLNAATTGGDHPSPVGVNNSIQLLPGGSAYRMAANNYYLGHARLLTMMALAIDPVDDPARNPNLPLPLLGNSLRSFIPNATGAWLYQQYAMYGDPGAVRAAYGLAANSSVGLASGGLPPEGMLYGHSYAYLFGQLLALQTAGFNDVNLSGPQIGLIGAPVWDRFVQGMYSSLTPDAKVFAGAQWLGPVFQMASYGDILRLWITPDFTGPFALLPLLDQQTGQQTHVNDCRWFLVNALEGGPGRLLSRVSNPWTRMDAILYFMALDPTAPAATDPRPSLPLAFYDAPAGRLLARSDWSPNATTFDFRCSWISINHQVGDAGQFEFYRKGEWLTKEISNYDNNGLGMTTPYHNTLGLQNTCANGTPTNLNWFENGEWANGSQWMLGLSAGDPKALASVGPDYAYAFGDMTKLYNRPSFWSPANSATNILHASRSIFWLMNDFVVVYDRATSYNSGLFKRFNLSFINAPAINGNVATQITPNGQSLFVQTLLPVSPSINVAFVAGNLNPIAELEPSRFDMTVEDATKPADVRFLHVLQGADPGVPMSNAALVQSVAGTSCDGAVFMNAAVFFVANLQAPFLGATLPIPSGVQIVYISGLAPLASYSVILQPTQNGSQIVVGPNGNGATADSAGVLNLSL